MEENYDQTKIWELVKTWKQPASAIYRKFLYYFLLKLFWLIYSFRLFKDLSYSYYPIWIKASVKSIYNYEVKITLEYWCKGVDSF